MEFQNIISEIVSKVVRRMDREKMPVIVNLSNRHAHISGKDVGTLFGKGYELKKARDLMQPGQFACEETVKIAGLKGSIDKVRVLGPTRAQSQVEVSVTDSFALGSKPPVRESGVLQGSAPVKIIGTAGSVDLPEGLIIAQRHVHMTPRDAETFGLKDKEIVRVKYSGARGGILDNVVVRVRADFSLECHLDTDEGNALGIRNGDRVYIL